MKIGILALQGAVEPHEKMLASLGASSIQVRKPEHLKSLSGIILPGGESTTMLHILKLNSLWEPLREFVDEKPTYGVCAGSILLAKKVFHPEQASLEAMNFEVTRNAYGRQAESFIAELDPKGELFSGEKFSGIFIRAPKFTNLGANVRTLLEFKNEPVLIEQGHLLAGAFHPELGSDTRIHAYFLHKCETHHG
jgi:pyridoxal 5'-phosphate synthase pdxT subunit